MNTLGKKAGYLKGLMEGMTFADSAQEKLTQAVVDLLGELCDRVEAVDDLLDDLNDYVESIDDDLAELESEHDGLDGDGNFNLLDDEYEDEDEEYLDDLDNASDRLHLIGGKDDEDEDGSTIGGVLCPDCKKPFFIGLEDPEGATYACPHCGHRVTPEPLTPENAPIAHPAED